jgi:hypothetical protein
MITEKCDAACAHCWFDCDLTRGVTMSQYDAQNYVDKVLRIPSIEWISLTGGEPMLHANLVEDVVAYASDHGLKTELVTNCSWAATPKKAFDLLRRLSDAGLTVLNISVDDFHQATIPFERVKISYDSAKSLGIRIVVMTALSKSSKLRLVDVSRLLGEEIPPTGEAIPWEHAAIGIESGFTPVGRGAAISRSEWYIDGSPLTGGCGGVLRDLGVRPNGEVLACCSASATLREFELGNLENQSLEGMLMDAWGRDVFKVLSEKGPMGLLKTQPQDVYVNKCHLCYERLKELQ